MARFSQALLQGLLQPQMQEGLFEAARNIGMTPSLMMAEKERKALEAQKKEQQMALLQRVNQAQAAAEQGDMNALNMQREGLMQIYNDSRDPNTQAAVLDAISGINAARPAAQKTAQANKARSIIQAEKALDEMKKDRAAQQAKADRGELVDRVFTVNDDRAMQALEQRLAVMKQDAQAVAEADSIKYQARYTEIQQRNQLAEQQATANRRALSSVKFESTQYKELAQKLRDSGFGETVDEYEKDQYDLEEARAKADEIRKKKSPLSSTEKETLRDYGFDPSKLELPQARSTLARITEREVEDRIRIASAPNARIANQAILSHVEATLRTVQEQGDLPWNLFDDLYNKIEDMNQEDIERLARQLQRPTGEELTEAQIQQAVINFVKEKFPTQWKEATQQQANIAEDVRLVEVLTADLLVGKGLATRDENGVVDLSGVSEENIRMARREVERRRSIVPALSEYQEGYVRSGMGSK